jgi:tetratricopeptide (TPR) repeat protein
MKNILYTIILSFLFSSSVFADWDIGAKAYNAGDYKTALKIYDKANKVMANNAELRLVHGHALKTIGKKDKAIEAYRKAYAARNDFGDAYWSMANLKTYKFTDQEVTLMTEKEAMSATVATNRIHLCFALGKHYEDQKQFKKSKNQQKKELKLYVYKNCFLVHIFVKVKTLTNSSYPKPYQVQQLRFYPD